jgi:aspartate aminotransferase-like enzyme
MATSTKLYPSAPSPLQEFSVVYTDRALNHMSAPYKSVMTDISAILKETYKAQAAVVIPGSGSYGMEAVARQFVSNKKALVIRNGFFSYRWTQIFDVGRIPSEHVVLKARCVKPQTGCGTNDCACGLKGQYAPPPVDEVVAAIRKERPAVLFAPHVETSTGIILPDAYIAAVAEAMHAIGGLMVLDCVASGTVWVDMQALGVDALITAPQKGWSGPACAGLVMLSARGVEATRTSESSSFAVNLRKWLEVRAPLSITHVPFICNRCTNVLPPRDTLQVMDTYEAGNFSYYTTMPTDALKTARDMMVETRRFGHDRARDAAWDLGRRVRAYLCGEKGLVSVAAPGFEAPGVVVVHTHDAAVAGKFGAVGVQIAAGVPFMVGEPAGTKTFRIGLFGLDKLADPAQTVTNLKAACDQALVP